MCWYWDLICKEIHFFSDDKSSSNWLWSGCLSCNNAHQWLNICWRRLKDSNALQWVLVQIRVLQRTDLWLNIPLSPALLSCCWKKLSEKFCVFRWTFGYPQKLLIVQTWWIRFVLFSHINFVATTAPSTVSVGKKIWPKSVRSAW